MDTDKIKHKYQRNARFYDRLIAPGTEKLRAEAIQKLALQRGDRVLDLGCGTGLSIPLLREAVGEHGVVYGIELSPDMIEIARRKAEDAGWSNVRLLQADAEGFELPEKVRGIVCFYTHDIMMSQTALPRALKFLEGGGRIVAAGGKLVRGWRGWLINPLTVAYSLPFITTLDRSRDPFTILRELLPDCQVRERKFGSQYLAWGTYS
jgi:demethylmenaquinone methyltransferase/2-methoxy-6-polyprenyl-1,4-benzoquinol methylase